MDFSAAASEVVCWVSANKVDAVVMLGLAAAAVGLGGKKYKEHREEYRKSETIVDSFVNRPKKKIVFPPNSPRT